MHDLIFNLVKNAIPLEVSNDFINEQIKKLSKKDIINLAQQELKSVRYLALIELENWDYWKQKKYKLEKLIKTLEK